MNFVEYYLIKYPKTEEESLIGISALGTLGHLPGLKSLAKIIQGLHPTR